MADIEFNPNVIYNKLVNLRAKPQSSGKLANGELQPVSSLRIDVTSVTKDVNRFRACDGSACFYCREWAIFIYKKNFTWMAAAKTTINNNVIKVDNNLLDEQKKIASIVCQQFNELILKYDDEKIRTNSSDNDLENIIDIMVHKILAWIKAPNRLYIIPDIFSNVEFDLSKFISSSTHDKDRDLICILDSIEIEKSHYQILKPHFHLLKLTNPPQQCHHTRPEWKVPTDLDLDRRVFNDLLFKEKSQNDEILKEGLSQVWSYVTNFLTSILQIEANRDQIFGKGCLTNMDNFMKEYQDESLPFKDYWAPIAEAYKKTPKSKKANLSSTTDTVDDIDAAFRTYIHNAKTVISFWEEGFIEKVLTNAIQFSEETQCILLGFLVDFQSRITNIPIKESIDEILTKCGNALIVVKDIKLMVSKRISIMRSDISKKSKELIQELEALDESWKTQSQRTTQGRLEKANNKEFRKRIKKFESTVQSTRQAAVTAIGALFPVTNLASICTNCLEILMTEGEIMEAIQLEKHYKNYEVTAKKFQEQREALLKDFEQGVETGRKVLAGIFGRLFLKEAWGLIAETLALKKQDAFLQLMDKGKTETVKKKKSDKDASNGASQSVDNPVPTEVSKKNKKKKRKSSSSVTTISSGDNQSVTVQQDNNLVLSQEPELQSNEPSTSQNSCHAEEQKPLIGTMTDNNLNNNTNSTQYLNIEKSSVLNSSQSQDFSELYPREFQDSNKSSNEENINKSPVLDSSQDSSEMQATSPHEFQESSQNRISTPPGLNTSTNSTPRLNQGSVAKGNNSTHEGLVDFDNFSRADLILLIQNLLSEKTQLVKTLVSMQQEVKAVTDRYTNLMEMSREREFQTFQLFEAHKKLEMDEATKYIQKLEARISQLEKNNVRSINGEYIDPWNSHITGSRSNVRCGNCGGQNHISQECITGCRYCGDPGHLSELCSSSLNSANLEI